MIDRNRSLIHMLMAGLVGLTFGLFIGWWVWPVQWIEEPGTAPASSAPAQSVESPAADSGESISNSSDVLDWVNQGLLYVAAALLLVGGVVIGYQLLRQSQGKDPPAQPFPLPFKRSRSNQATAPREPRPKSPPLAGRPATQRQPGLNWLRRESEPAGQATSEEPVFREQAVAAPRPIEPASHAPAADREPSHHGAARGEVNLHSTQQDDVSSPAGTPDFLGEDTDAPPEQVVEDERGLDSPASLDAPETAMEAIQGDEFELDEERSAGGTVGDSSSLAWAADEDSDKGEGALPAGAVAADSESEGLEDIRGSEEQELWQEDQPILPSGAPTAEVSGEQEQWAAPNAVEHEPFATSADPFGPVEVEDERTESSPGVGPEAEIVESEIAQVETGQVDRATRQLVGQFEANYAFGIQTYDESFTISSADGELLGACGMGINESVDRAAADSDQVRLLDIWLYDRSAVRSVSQPLISPGFDVSGLDDYAEGSGSDSSSPLEVRPGLTCTLQSDSIVLECTLKSASYLEGAQAPMPFRSVSVSLTVYVQS